MGRASREKGKRGEREFALELRRCGVEARRGVQHQGGADSPDVVSSLPVHWEVKRMAESHLGRDAAVAEWAAQVLRDAPAGTLGVIAHRADRGPWWVSPVREGRPLVWMRLDAFLATMNVWLEVW